MKPTLHALALVVMFLVALALTACTTITTSSAPELVARDLQAADRNDTTAQMLGILKENDPFSQCVRDDMAALGVGEQIKSFTPERVGIFTALSIINIEARKSDALLAALQRIVSDDACNAVVGRVARKLMLFNALSGPAALRLFGPLPLP